MHAFFPIVALLGLAAAQSDTTATGTSSSAAPNPTTECIAKCAAGDVNCQAVCVNVPAPNASMIEATNECSRNECTQGDSGPEDTKKYGECLASCASNYYYVSGSTPTGVYTGSTGSTASAPANTDASSTTGSGSSAATTGSSSSETGSSDSSESSASSTRSQAACKYQVKCSPPSRLFADESLKHLPLLPLPRALPQSPLALLPLSL